MKTCSEVERVPKDILTQHGYRRNHRTGPSSAYSVLSFVLNIKNLCQTIYDFCSGLCASLLGEDRV